MAVTTTASFVIAAVNATQTVDVTDTSPLPQNTVFTISDDTNAVVFQVQSLTSGTVFVIETLVVLAGATGNTMGAGANCTFASTPLSALPTNSSPAGSDLMYVVQSGASKSVTVASEMAAYVDKTSTQAIGGAKTFSSPPVMSGADITAASIPDSALATAYVESLTAGTGVTLGGNPGGKRRRRLFAACCISGATLCAQWSCALVQDGRGQRHDDDR
jgi:hypothetical protein